MEAFSKPFETACPSCDLLLKVPALAPGSRASCGRCGQEITFHFHNAQHRAAAFALTALILLLLACSFPFLSFERAGFGNEMTLPQTGWALYEDGALVLSGLIFGFIIAVPTSLLGILLALQYALHRRRAWPHLTLLARLLTQLQPWSMAEVFIIGVIVSLVKLASMADIVIGIAFWAYAAFVLCFTAALANIDRHDLWDAIEELQG